MEIEDYKDMLDVIRQIGFLPLFSGDVAGFSVEDMAEPGVWWTGDWETDPWKWRIRAESLHWGFPIPDTDTICDDDLCIRIGLKVKTFERLVSAGIITIADLKNAVSDRGWYVKIPKVGKKTADMILARLDYMTNGI